MDAFLGQIIMFAGNYAPDGWYFCDGTLLPISDNEALFSLIGTAYGGDGTTNFGLPDLRGRLPVDQGEGRGLTNYVAGERSGTEMVTLTDNTMPVHTHPLMATTNAATTASPQNMVLAGVASDRVFYFDPPPPTGTDTFVNVLANGAVQSTGASQAHSNMMPTLAVSFLICTQGEYPQPQ